MVRMIVVAEFMQVSKKNSPLENINLRIPSTTISATAAATVEYDVIELKNNESTDIDVKTNLAYGEIKPLYL